jgi:tetratricopeptide (TPR) repeat protein
MIIFSIKTHLKKLVTYILPFVLLAVVAVSCSTKKNTWVSRTYQATNTRFNVYFNGYNSFNDGLKNITKANKEDYSGIIPMYPISHHSNASAGTTDMDRTIEKCRKAIKLHSIKVKPKRDYRKMNDPEYKLFYNQEEFNPAMSEAWLLLAKAEFHKGDFLGSSGTFSYIVRHYSSDKDMVAVCQLWIARAYGEMGWIYEAEQVLSKLVQDNLKSSHIGLFASVNADLLLKKHQFKEAIPFLELALSKEENADLKLRFGYLLAQLYHKTGDDKAAYEAYSNVIKKNPTYEMDFNARINRAQLNTSNVYKVRKELHSMLKNRNNKNYLDQVYYALGNSYLVHGDTLRAIDNYKLSVDTSSRKGIDKAVTLITLGDLYYFKREYVLAQPCYDEASKIITIENDDYSRVSKRAETLSELVQQNDIVVLQDSLQELSTKSEIERMKVVNKVIERLIADEKHLADKALKENEARSRGNLEDIDFNNIAPIGAQGGWYFYNPEIMRSGSTDFSKKWGSRKLEDNWRRTNKGTSLFGDENAGVGGAITSAGNDSLVVGTKPKTVTDNKKPEFYLRQIPVTPAQLKKSNEEIATALYSMAQVYKDGIEDYPMAISTYKEFIRRFGSDARVPDAYFAMYMIQKKNGNEADAEKYRVQLVKNYPDTKYYKILSQPDYAERLERMNREQDSIYSLTYDAYNQSNYETVFKNVEYVQKNYPLTTLMPKFMFLNALSIGKKDSQIKFKTALDSLVVNYPTSDVSSMAKDILALMKQGMEAKNGTSSGTLLSRREEKTKEDVVDIAQLKFSTEKQARHRVLLISKTNLENMHKLQFSVAAYNFERFMIKDFDLVISKLDTVQSSLSVTNFESYDEAMWYLNSITSDQTLSHLFAELGVKKLIISDENFGLLKNTYTLNDYYAFLSKPLTSKPVAPISQKQAKKAEVVEPIKGNIAKAVVAIQPKAVEKVIEKPTVVTMDTKTSDNKTTAAKPVEKLIAKEELKIVDTKPTEKKQPESPVSKPQENKVPEIKPTEKVADKPIQKTADQPATKVTEKTVLPVQPQKTEVAKPVAAATTPASAVVVNQPKPDDVPLFKGLFGYKANEPHFMAFYVLSGSVDFVKLQTTFDAFNKQNYSAMNLKLTMQKEGAIQIITIGTFVDAATAKSYLYRIVKDKSLFDGLRGADYRNLIGSQKNINILIKQNALKTYFEFMQQYYLK